MVRGMTPSSGPEPSPLPAVHGVARDLVARELLDILEETFDEPHGIYLDRGTGLFATLADIPAAEASSPPFTGGATIAAKVAHVLVYLDLIERYMRTGVDERVDWGEVWRTVGPVTEPVWARLQGDLRETYGRVHDLLATQDDWDDGATIAGALGIVVHTAYHLGEVREATGAIRGGTGTVSMDAG
jgi:hypothetical protein